MACLLTRCALAAKRLPLLRRHSTMLHFRTISTAVVSSADQRSRALPDLGSIHVPDAGFVSIVRKYALPRPLAKEVDTLGKLGIVVRSPATQVINAIRSEPTKTHHFVIGGSEGVGKTVSLLNIAHFCSASGWIVAHVPFGLKWTHNSGDLDRSLHASGRVDQNVDAAAWLSYFAALNQSILASTILQGKYTWGSRKTVMPEKSTLLQLCNLGIREQRFACDVVGVVLKELREYSKSPILIAIDESNAFLHFKTRVFGFDKQLLGPQQLTLIKHFHDFISGNKQLNAGAIVLVSSSGKGLLDRTNSHALDRLSSPFVHLHVPAMEQDEVKALWSYYRSTGWVAKDADSSFHRGLSLITGNIPAKISALSRAV